MQDYADKKAQLRNAILKGQRVKIWVKGTPSNSGHVIDPYEILEDAKFEDYLYGSIQNQERLTLTGINSIKKIETLEERFKKPSEWKTKIDLSKYSISKD